MLNILKKMEPTIAIFTFNTEAQIYCGSNNSKKCLSSDFVSRYVNTLGEKLPDIIIINLQESSITNPLAKFKSNNLSDRFIETVLNLNPSYKYFTKKLKGIGRMGLRGLTTTLLVSDTIHAKYCSHVYRPMFGSSVSIIKGQQYGKGAIMIDLCFIKNSELYRVQFINTHLPFSGDETSKDYRDTTLRETLEYLCDSCIHIDRFIIGDLNYRVDLDSHNLLEAIKNISMMSPEEKEVFLTEYYKFDQLRGNMFGYVEGINGEGPKFMPTCKMAKECGCVERPYQTIKKNTVRIPSWCDRILHTDTVTCINYDSFDDGFTCKSDHKAVIGLYKLTTPTRMSNNHNLIEMNQY